MEFDEMKKVWDTQNNQPIYALNEEALHHRIIAKKHQAFHIMNFSELLSIAAYSFTGAFTLALGNTFFMYALATWMLASGGYFLYSRVRRIRGSQQFDRTLLGDLAHAIAMATYQVRISQLMRWNIFPIAALVVVSVWDGKSMWFAIGVLFFFVITHFASGWEHNIYKSKKRELEVLREKLESK